MRLSELIARLQSLQAQSSDDPEVNIRLIDHDDVTIHWAPVYEIVPDQGSVGPTATISGVPPEMAEELELDK